MDFFCFLVRHRPDDLETDSRREYLTLNVRHRPDDLEILGYPILF